MTNISEVRDIALRSLSIMADGELADFLEVIAPSARNHEDVIEPPACRVGGPTGFHATAQWLRSAFTELRHDLHHVATAGDLVALDMTMHGRHTGEFAVYTLEGGLDRVWAPTGKTFAVRQSHWQRIVDGQVVEHWAVRDDLGQGFQLGWMPPTPAYLVRCARAKRRAQRDQRTSA